MPEQEDFKKQYRKRMKVVLEGKDQSAFDRISGIDSFIQNFFTSKILTHDECKIINHLLLDIEAGKEINLQEVESRLTK